MITPKFTPTQLKRSFEEMAAKLDQAIISRLQLIGETFIKNARESGTYNDITGNLRSSIGYIVLRNGFKRAGSGFDKYAKGTEGQRSGKALLRELSNKFNTGYVLIVVAGMDYAASVESWGKDVLTSSGIIAKNDLQRAFKKFSG